MTSLIPVAARSADRQRLLEQFRRKASLAAQAGELPQPAGGASQQAPLSFAQEGLWFLDRLNGASAQYNSVLAVRLTGRLDAAALQAALQALVDRHGSLRTVFIEQDGQPVQRMLGSVALDLQVTDLRPPTGALASAEQTPEAALERALGLAMAEPFDLSQAPLLRATLFRLDAHQHVLLMVVHHIVSDGWSMGVMTRDLDALYRAACAGQPDPLPPLPFQFADFARWQRNRQSGRPMAGHLDYWRRQLDGLEPLQLPLDRPRPSGAQSSVRGATARFQLPGALVERLRALSVAEGVTVFMTLLAAFKVLLSRHSGQSDIAVASPVAGRSHADFEPLIGYFVNMLVLRTDLSGTAGFRQLLARVRDMALDAYAHQDMPFDRLVAALSPVRDLGRNPFCDVSFVLHNTPAAAPTMGELSMQRLPVDTGTARFDLALALAGRPDGGLDGSIEYRSDLLDAGTMQRLAGHFARLLEAIAMDPDGDVMRLPMLAPAERAQLLVEWNRTGDGSPGPLALAQLVERQAQRRPQATALVFEQASLTYDELNRRANRLARKLRALGVGPDMPVGLCLHRSIDLVVAMLATVKAGGAYLPLDPEYPSQRLAFMLQDSAATVLVTSVELRSRPTTADADDDAPGAAAAAPAVLCIDGDWQHEAGDWPDTDPDPLAGIEHLACVIYTSGSTGAPKGVEVCQRSVAALVCNNAQLPIGPDDRVAQCCNSAFDPSTWEIWGALVNGATLVVVAKERLLASDQLAAQIADHGITHMCLPAAVFSDHAVREPGMFGRLRLVTFGGDAVDPHTVLNVLASGPPAMLVNAYGPTEATTASTAFDIVGSDWARQQQAAVTPAAIPIGRPLAGERCYVLDALLQPVPAGVIGRLYIAGVGLARGYLKRPDLTAGRFIDAPFQPGERLYDTGDLVRHLPDGNLVFVGRADQQAKIRGFRVEPGEVESVLGVLPGVHQCAVIVREDRPGDKRLVAYVVAGGGPHAATAAGLRDALAQQLPAYLVPAAIVLLAALPLTPNGKLDRRALPAPAFDGGGRLRVAPRSPLELMLAQLWGELLGIADLGVHDNFFEMGGHSLLAAQMMSRLHSLTGARLPLRALFECPTVAELSARLHSDGAAAPDAAESPIAAGPAHQPAPLSPAQQGLWFLDALTDGQAPYNIAQAFRLHGDLQVDALRGALQALVDRHACLRTVFENREGTPEQRVLAQSTVELPVTDLTGVADTGGQLLAQHLARHANQAFDLSVAPLMRACLLRLGAGEHVLALVVHHIVSDGWSMGVLMRDLDALYDAQVAGQPCVQASLPIQFTDYARWLAGRLDGPHLSAQLDYWRQRLAGLEPLQLPTDRPRPLKPGYHGAVVRFDVPRPVADAFRRLSREHNATLFMTLLAAFQTLLARHAGQDDIAVGSPVAGRSRVELEGLVGYFVNSVVLRTDLSGNPRFTELLARVRDVALDAFAHDDMPFDRLVAQISPDRDLARNPLYQVSFTLQNGRAAMPRLGGLVTASVPVDAGTAKFDLSLTLTEDGSQLAGEFEYSTELFDVQTIERMAGHFGVLLAAIAADPQTPIRQLPLLDPVERDRMLVQWNDTARVYRDGVTLADLVEAQVRRSPDAVAVIDETQTLTYRALNEQANRLAAWLQAAGVGPDRLVGVCLERGVPMVTALLAVVKAGGAYVPLDPEYPAARLQYMLNDTAATVVLTQASLAAGMPPGAARLACLDEPAMQAQLSGCPDSDPPRQAGPSDLAYVIYTSGSTGQPKGVMIPHRGICNHVMWISEQLNLQAGDRLLQRTSISFDASVWEFFAPLQVGATLVLARPGGQRDAGYLAQLACDAGITVMQSVPSELRALLQEPAFARCASLRYMICGGEALERELAATFLDRFPGVTLGNFYGPSEASNDSACLPLSAPPGPQEPAIVPIGRPIANVRCHILDAWQQPVPVGVTGELLIGGTGLARGYLNLPDLTAQRFVADPFRPGERLYRTGDLARYRADGTIEYQGRIDHQVKLRGQRIELGEIEVALQACAGVSEAVVVAREDQPGLKYLVGYVVGNAPAGPHDAPQIDADALVAQLQHSLPAHMVPAAIVPLQALPLSPNGKIDRKALMALAPARAAREPVAPRNMMEETLLQVWRDVLGVTDIGVFDNFFAVGGHSLLATRIIARLRGLFGSDLSLRMMFETPTIASLAAALHASSPAASDSPIGKAPADLPVPLSSAQQALWFIDRLGGPGELYLIPQVKRLHGMLDVRSLHAAIQALVNRHDALRTAFVARDGGVVAQVLAQVRVELPLVDMSGPEDAQRLAQTVHAGATAAFDLARAPLLRAALYRVGENEHLLLLVVHHIVADGWSMNVIDRELDELYRAACEERLPGLQALPIGFADYAVWQRAQLEGPAMARHLDYWRQQLQQLPTLELPTDRPRRAQASQRGDAHRFVLPADLTRRLGSLAESHRVTPFMLLLAGFKLLLSRYSGQHDIVVGSPVAGRPRAELEGLVGYFVNTVVLRTRLQPQHGFDQLLAQVRQVCLDAFAHDQLPFERLVAALCPQREPGRNPLYQVSFALEPAAQHTAAMGPLQVVQQPLQSGAAKFDLALSMTEQADGTLAGKLDYATDLFDPQTAARMVGHFDMLLRALAVDPSRPLAQLDMLSSSERACLRQTWNDTTRPYPADSTLAQLFRQQADRCPSAPAVRLDDLTLTYGELDRQANRLAHRLRALGVMPGVMVGVCLERSPRMIAALLAVVKAGGAYVPLDPDYPVERLAYMLQDCAAPVVLAQAGTAQRLPAGGATLLMLDDEQADWMSPGWPDSDLPPAAQPMDPAYVIYTSGSTGQPKGVVVPHRAVVRLVMGSNYVTLSPDSCIAQASNASFDAATFEIWGALLHGGLLAIVPKAVLLSAAQLGRCIVEQRIDTLFLTTALFNEHALRAPAIFAPLHTLLFGGEAVDPVAVERVFAQGRPRRLLNVYGPTETTTFATYFEVTASSLQRTDAGAVAPIPIGVPISNTCCLVLDEGGRMVPVGVAGELFIGGPGVALGYLNQPDLTAGRFVADPDEPAQRLYRTGDQVRWRADGNLEYLGRIDAQVKIRGFRIEPGEIEALLARHPDVRQCAVIAREDQPGDKRLVAYLVAADPAVTVPAAGLRALLVASLPSYMVPSAFVFVGALPLTANGKLDRAALPAPAMADSDDRHAPSQPLDPLQAQLAAIWRQVLGVGTIDPDDSFFDLGGHSLLAIGLLDAIERQTGHNLGLAALLRAPTVRSLAELLRAQGNDMTCGCVVPIQTGGSGTPLFFVSGFGGAILPFHRLGRELGPAQPLYVLDLNAPVPGEELTDQDNGAGLPAETLCQIASRLLADMRAVQPTGPYQLAGFSLGGDIVYEMARQLREQGQTVSLLAMLDTYAPGYLKRRHVLVRTVLHIAHALRLGPRHAAGYLAERVRKLRKYFVRTGPRVVQTADALADARVVAQMERRSQRVLQAWYAHRVQRYAGQLTLIRAEVDRQEIGVIDNDPQLGWGDWVDGAIDIASLQARHTEMLDAQHAPALAALLRPRLIPAGVATVAMDQSSARAPQRAPAVEPATQVAGH